jgi:D-arginine dehydrogenase
MQYDFLVVGAGLSGTAAACELASHGSVLLVEAEATPGYHASGRSAALFTAHQGTPLVQAINRASAAFFAKPPAGFTDHPLLAPRGGLTIAEPGQEHMLQDLLALVARQPPCPVPTTTLAGFEAAGVGVFFGFLG